MGSRLRARNCLGCGPAIRVPSPAAGRIANTCITGGVYNGGAVNGADIHAAGARQKVPRRNAASGPYDFGMHAPLPATLPIDTTLLKPGLRLAVGLRSEERRVGEEGR